jgi:hypothetical protein
MSVNVRLVSPISPTMLSAWPAITVCVPSASPSGRKVQLPDPSARTGSGPLPSTDTSTSAFGRLVWPVSIGLLV